MRIMPALEPIVYKQDVLWVIWSPGDNSHLLVTSMMVVTNIMAGKEHSAYCMYVYTRTHNRNTYITVI